MSIKKKLLVVILISLLAIVIVLTIVFIYHWWQIKKEMTEQEETETSKNWETYRNEEWGFEFQYPKDLFIQENSFKSYYSKFNLKIVVKIGEKFDPVLGVNVVLPEFVESSFGELEKVASEVIVGGISGIKYSYEFNNRKETAVILPFGEYRLILVVHYEEYENTFNQILATFKFIEK